MRIFGNLIFAIIARMFCGNHLNSGHPQTQSGENDLFA